MLTPKQGWKMPEQTGDFSRQQYLTMWVEVRADHLIFVISIAKGGTWRPKIKIGS